MHIPNSAVTDWLEITQDCVNRFAAATGDEQWIHVDARRAAEESPYGATVAHGFLVLSLLPLLLRQAVSREGVRMSVNYGFNRVRFTAPVIVGSRIRARFEASSIEEKEGATKVVWSATVEPEWGDKPCCVAEWIVVYYA